MKTFTHCPFCTDKLSKGKSHELLCRGKEDHTFIQLDQALHKGGKRDEIYHLKIRVGPGDVRYYFEGSYYGDEVAFISMWAGRNNSGERLSLQEVVYPDLSNGIAGALAFIKMHLVFN